MRKQFQLELFQSQQYQPDRPNKRQHRGSFFGFIRVHEKAISFVIVFFIVSLISFSLGVEKGKRLANVVKNEERLIDRAQLKKPIQPEKRSAGKEKKDISKYTVQVATFKTRTYAQKEAGRLKKKGLDALIIPRGKFVCVCIGSFSKKQEAKVTLNQLKTTYRDCFIRRL